MLVLATLCKINLKFVEHITLHIGIIVSQRKENVVEKRLLPNVSTKFSELKREKFKNFGEAIFELIEAKEDIW